MPLRPNRVALVSGNKKTISLFEKVFDEIKDNYELVPAKAVTKIPPPVDLIVLEGDRNIEHQLILVRQIKETDELTPIVIIVDEVTPHDASVAIKNGIFDYLEQSELEPKQIAKMVRVGVEFNKIEIKREIALQNTREKESNLRAVLNNTDDAILLIDADYTILDFNKPSAQFTKLAFDSIPQIFHDILSLISDEKEKTRWKNNLKLTLEGKKSTFLDVFKRNGEEFHYRVSCTPVNEGKKVIGVSIIASNITEIIKTEREKELREANFRSLIQNTYDPMWSIDKDFRLIAFNSAYEDLASQYLGRPPVHGDSVIFETYTDELEALWEKSYRRALRGERFEEEMVFQYGGGNIYIENEFNPIRNSKDEIIGVTCFSRDVTERRQQEEINKEFASIVEFSNDAIIGFDTEGTIVNWNPAATSSFGYKSYEVVGQKTNLLFGKREFKKAQLKLRKIIKGGKIDRFESVMISKSGEKINVSLSFSLHRDSEGKITKISAIIRDITEQVKAEKELIEQQHFIESITETSPSILYVYDFYEGKSIYINRRASELLGYSREEVREFEQGIYEIVHPEDKPKVLAKNKVLLHSEDDDIIDLEYRVKHKKGHYIWLNARNTIFKRTPEGNVLQILGTARDITQQKKNAAEIEMLSLFAKHTVNNVIISDPDGSVQYVNDAFVSNTGYTLKSLSGKKIEEALSGEKTDQKILKRIQERKKGVKLIKEEILFYKKDGTPYWAAIFINPVKDENGKLKQYVQIQIDISDRKRNEELTLQAKELAEKNAKFKDEFLANMSHEIRTPLNGIIGMIEILEHTNLDEEQKHYVDTFRTSSKSLLEIINNILDLSKLEAGKMELKKQDFRLTAMLRNLHDLYTPMAKQKELSLKLEIDKRVPEVIHADENKLFQIASNLLSNSLKFTDRGSVTLRVTPTPKKKNTLSFEIIDTGIGISEENVKRLFTKFTQVDQSSVKRFAGTGLGLAISQELVHLFGGEIGVTSEEGKGSTFQFTIPYKPASLSKQELAKKQDEQEKISDQFGLHVLLVEDKFINQEVGSLILKQLGCTTITADNGQEALEKYKEDTFDLILMDIQMPVMDGVEATQELRKRFSSLPPIMAVSANAMEGDAEKYIEAGMDDYLAKPITIRSLAKKLNKWFGKKTNTVSSTKESPPTVTSNAEEIEKLPVLRSDIVETLKGMGDEETLKNLFQSFVEDAKVLQKELNEAYKKQDYTETRKANHTLNGISGTIGASQMNKICINLSTAIKEEDFNTADQLVELLNKKLAVLLNHIEEEIIETEEKKNEI